MVACIWLDVDTLYTAKTFGVRQFRTAKTLGVRQFRTAKTLGIKQFSTHKRKDFWSKAVQHTQTQRLLE